MFRKYLFERSPSLYHFDFALSEFGEVLDQDATDGCWEEWDLDALEGDEEEAFQEAWDEDSHEGIENLGWVGWDSELFFDGPLDVENLGEYVAPVYDDVEEDDNNNEESSGGWPN